jgi:gamma-D-glutamyl-L-lysine dipeptidyl-peptidase
MGERLGEHTFVFQLTALRAAPEAGGEQVSQVLPGEPLELLEERDGWANIRTAYDYPGWVPVSALGGEADPEWLEPQAPDPLTAARAFLGAPYEWGGMTARGIDCSGLVHMSYRAAGRLVPRDADQQEAAGARVDTPSPGDLVSYGSPADHVAFWLGRGRILHATGRDGVNGVVEESEPDELLRSRHIVFRL